MKFWCYYMNHLSSQTLPLPILSNEQSNLSNTSITLLSLFYLKSLTQHTNQSVVGSLIVHNRLIKWVFDSAFNFVLITCTGWSTATWTLKIFESEIIAVIRIEVKVIHYGSAAWVIMLVSFSSTSILKALVMHKAHKLNTWSSQRSKLKPLLNETIELILHDNL